MKNSIFALIKFTLKMAETQVLLPKMGESVAEATITKWLKAVGDKVEAEESLVEIATDKVDSEVPAPSSGIIAKILFKEGDVVKVGNTIAIISSEETVPATKITSLPETEKENNESEKRKREESTKNEKVNDSASKKPEPVFETSNFKPQTSRFYSPLVKNIAKQEGISLVELEKLSGSGKDGRITKQDILNYVEVGRKQSAVSSPQSANYQLPTTDSELTEIIEMDRMRKLIADHMVMSKHTSPHVTSYVEADVTNLVQWREKAKKIYEKRDGEKITFTPIFIEAVVKALKDFPMVNVSVDGYKIIRKKFINIGMATALPSGNLIVPVIKNADYLNLTGLVKTVNDLANRARQNKLQPDEIQNGTFTITNVGTFGNVMGTPIINQPQVAILATGAIRKKPAVIETEMGDTIGIRHMMFLSLSYDHRVVDGALGGSFLRRVADYLEKFDANREI